MQPVLPERPRTPGNNWESGTVEDAKLDAALESPPAEFDEPEELFAKVEDDEIEALNEDLRERVEEASESDDDGDGDEAAEDGEAAAQSIDLEPLEDERISFDDFQDRPASR